MTLRKENITIRRQRIALILATIVSGYLLVYGLLFDVLRDKQYAIFLKSGILLGGITVAYLCCLALFIRKIGKTITCHELLVSLCVMIGTSLLIQLMVIEPVTRSNTAEEKFLNPMYEKYIEIARKEGINLSFTKEVWDQGSFIQYDISALFKNHPKSLDILFVGDSSLARGFIPEVVEQITGKKIAVFAYGSNLLNVESSKMFKQIADYYLKDDGILVYSFDVWTQEKLPHEITIVTYMDEINDWRNGDLEKYSKAKQQSFFSRYLSLRSFSDRSADTSLFLQDMWHLKFKNIPLYDKYIEQKMNPELYARKLVNRRPRTQFLRWNRRSISEYNPQYRIHSLQPVEKVDVAFQDSRIEINSRAAITVFPGTIVYMIPLHTNDLKINRLRNIYSTYYLPAGVSVMDLPSIQPEGGIRMQGGSHVGNEGGLLKSILIAKWFIGMDNFEKPIHASH